MQDLAGDTEVAAPVRLGAVRIAVGAAVPAVALAGEPRGVGVVLRAPAAQPPSGPRGTLAMAVSTLGTAENYLPWLEAGREGWIVLGALYETLIDSDPMTGDYTPGLAERYEVEDGGKRWRFHLRKGVKFHDGSEFTAEDVKFSYEGYISDQSVNAAKPVFQALVDRVEVAPGEHAAGRILRRIQDQQPGARIDLRLALRPVPRCDFLHPY